MSKLVIFRIEGGDFHQGFPVSLEIRENGRLCAPVVFGSLAPAPNLLQSYGEWQQNYYVWGNYYSWLRQIDVPSVIESNHSGEEEENINNAANEFESVFKEWLNHSSLGDITEELLQTVNRHDPVRFIIQTSNPDLQKLPWELWDLLRRRYRHPEVALSSRGTPARGPLGTPVKILVILGSDENIDIQTDENILNNSLPRAELKLLRQPSSEDLREILITQPWHIIFFAGHSSTTEDGTDGRIWINNNDYLSPGQLRTALEKAVENGLKLAIFNSCDGLGLARQLEILQIPHIIVMREPIHDRVAQDFLKNFLGEFASGSSLHESIKEARDRLRLIEHRSPKASWLPVIFQNPEEPPLYYPQEEVPPAVEEKPIRLTKRLKILGAIALILLGFVIAIATHKFIIAPDATWATGISLGEEILISGDDSPMEKEEGKKAFAAGRYKRAMSKFKHSLDSYPNDPETRIYFNNAKAAALSDNPIKIAVSVPIGSNQEVAEEILRGVALAQEETNSNDGLGVIDDRLLQVAIANDNNDGDRARDVASKFVKDTTIIAAVAHNASNASAAARDIYTSGGLVAISPTSFAEEVRGQSYVFRMVPHMTYLADKLSQYIVDTVSNPVITICFDPNAPDNTYYKKQFQQTFLGDGGRYFDVACQLHEANFKPNTVIEDIKNNSANGVMVAPHVDKIPEAIKVFQAIKEKKLAIKLFGSPTFNTYKTIKLGGEAVEGLTLSVPWYPAENDLFSLRSEKVWQAKTNTWRTSMAYDTTKVIIAGLEKLFKEKQELTRQNLDERLRKNFEYSGVTGKIEFDPTTGERDFDKYQTYLDALIQIKNGEFVRVQ
jgi:branched-chain amino acid transport system substrate-binding protein